MQTEYRCKNIVESQLDQADGKITDYTLSCSRVLLENVTLTYVFEEFTRIVLNPKFHYCVYKNPLLDYRIQFTPSCPTCFCRIRFVVSLPSAPRHPAITHL
jgi:hypothetical protein